MANVLLQGIVGKTRHALQKFRLQRFQAKTVIEQRRTKRNRNSEIVGCDDRAKNAGIGGRKFCIEFRRRPAFHQKFGPLGEQPEHALKFGAVPCQNVERSTSPAAGRGVTMPGWCFP